MILQIKKLFQKKIKNPKKQINSLQVALTKKAAFQIQLKQYPDNQYLILKINILNLIIDYLLKEIKNK